MSGPRLHPDDLATLADLVADRLFEKLVSRPDQAPQGLALSLPASGPESSRESVPCLLDAKQVGECFGLTAEWVRDHADDLDAIRIGDGPRPRLRFDVEKVAAALNARTASETSDKGRTPTVPASTGVATRRRSGTALDTLPVRSLKPHPVTTTRPGAVAAARGMAHGEDTP